MYPNKITIFTAFIALITGTTKGGTQLIVQNPKNMQQSTVTVQQLMRPQQSQIVLGKRIIPVGAQANARQTIQVMHKKNVLSSVRL